MTYVQSTTACFDTKTGLWDGWSRVVPLSRTE
jgi:hypothetical protein